MNITELELIKRESERYKMENSKLTSDIELYVGVADDDIKIIENQLKMNY